MKKAADNHEFSEPEPSVIDTRSRQTSYSRHTLSHEQQLTSACNGLARPFYLLALLPIVAAAIFYLTKLEWYFTSSYSSAITAENIKAGDWFADSLSATNDTLAVAAFRSDSANHDAGAVYIYNRYGTEWRQTAELLASDAQPDQQMGFDVLVQGNTVAVGSVGKFEVPPTNLSQGRVFIFEENSNGWAHTQSLVAEDGEPGDLFGYSLASNDEYLFIGAKNSSAVEGVEKSGAVYIFNRRNWTQVGRLVAPDAAAGDRFGTALLILGNQLLVSATNAKNDASPSGRVYTFDLHRGAGNPELVGTLIPPPESISQFFGVSVKGSNEHLAIGSSHWAGVEGGGSVHTYRKIENNWSLTGQLDNCGGEEADMFGFRLAINKHVLLVSEHLADVNGSDSGAVSVFIFDQDQERWMFQSRHVAPDGHRGDYYGISLAITPDKLFIGAEKADVKGKESGAMYVMPMNTLTDAKSISHVSCDRGHRK